MKYLLDCHHPPPPQSLLIQQCSLCLAWKHDIKRHLFSIWAVTCDFQQSGTLASVDSDKHVRPPKFMHKNFKCCSVSSLIYIEYTIYLSYGLMRLRSPVQTVHCWIYQRQTVCPRYSLQFTRVIGWWGGGPPYRPWIAGSTKDKLCALAYSLQFTWVMGWWGRGVWYRPCIAGSTKDKLWAIDIAYNLPELRADEAEDPGTDPALLDLPKTNCEP